MSAPSQSLHDTEAGAGGTDTSQPSKSTGTKADSDEDKPGRDTKPDDAVPDVDEDRADADKGQATDDEHTTDNDKDGEVVNRDIARNDGEDADRLRANDRRTPVRDKRTPVQDKRTPAPTSAYTARETVDEQVGVVEISDPPDYQGPVLDAHPIPVTPAAVPETPAGAVPTSEPSEPDVVDSIATAVSSVVTTLLNPFAASTTPEAPAAQPQWWTLLAAARREFDTAAASPSLEQTGDAAVPAPLSASATPTLTSMAATGPTPINIIGTAFFNVFDAVVKVFEGPPTVPHGSKVTVVRAPLEIDCGDGYTADADWYFPTEGPPPTKLIYLQHGGFARAGLYNVTAAELAERNHAIVVAPSITTNIFACDGCMEGGDPMHAAGAAGYYSEFAPDDETRNDLVGVLLLDISPIGGAVPRGVAKIPTDIPVYAIGAEPNVLDGYGDTEPALVNARPNQFVGVRLVDGNHSDAWQSTNVLAQLAVGLATGFPQPQNVEAVQVIAQGWITDWYQTDPNAPRVGIYGELGTTTDIETTAGVAHAYILPAPAPQLTIIDLVLKALIDSTAYLQFSQLRRPRGARDRRFNAKLHTKHAANS
ncbi:MAG: hypothetical protein ACRDU5_16885 [Mycobacterium sp.]